MTLRTTVLDQTGAPVPNAYVSANIQNTGQTYTRFTDGNGYADVALLSDTIPDGAQVTLLVSANNFLSDVRYLTLDMRERTPHQAHSGDEYDPRTVGDDIEVVVTLSPF